MMIVELREAAFDKAFEMMDEAKLHEKKMKMVLCALEDALYDCYEASKNESWEEDDFEDVYKSEEESENPEDTKDEMNYRHYRGSMRNYGGSYNRNLRMRRSMRRS